MAFIEWLKKYENQRSLMYVAFTLLIALPFISPLGLPIPIDKYTTMFYEEIENLEPGDNVLVAVDFGSANWGELGAGGMALKKHLARKITETGIRVVFYATTVEGPLLLERIFDETGGTEDLGEYGTDWANLGYLPGGAASLAAMALPPNGFHDMFNEDYFRTPLDELMIMNEIRSIDEIDLIIRFESGGGFTYIDQFVTPYNKRFIEICQGVHVAPTVTWIKTGQMQGIIASLRGSAEYELLIGEPGIAVVSTDALSLGHLMVILVMILGNIQGILSRKQKVLR